jgi:hypothetical protein
MRKLLPLVTLFFCFTLGASAQSQDQTANGREMTGAFTIARAMKLVYGSYDYSRMSSSWTPNQTRNYPNPWPNRIDVWLLMDMPYVEDGRETLADYTSSAENNGSHRIHMSFVRSDDWLHPLHEENRRMGRGRQ